LLRRKDGTVIEVQFWGQNIIYGGRKARMVAIRDLTEQKRLEQQSIELSVERERSQFLDDFINDLSHDIRTPITSLKTFLYLLRNQTDEEKRTEYFDKMDIQVTQLAKLVENIITISRLEKGAKFTLQTVKVASVLNPTVNSFQSKAESKSLTLSLEIDPDVPSLYLNPIEFSRAVSH
jgi:signal transduction histidine kinase